MARYVVELTIEVEMEIDPAVVAVALTPEWQAQLYPMDDEADVLEMLAWNCAVKSRELSSLDGWADRADGDLEVIRCNVENTEVLESPS